MKSKPAREGFSKAHFLTRFCFGNKQMQFLKVPLGPSPANRVFSCYKKKIALISEVGTRSKLLTATSNEKIQKQKGYL